MELIDGPPFINVIPEPAWHDAAAHVVGLGQAAHVVLLLRYEVALHGVHVLGADMTNARPSSDSGVHHMHVVPDGAAEVHVA